MLLQARVLKILASPNASAVRLALISSAPRKAGANDRIFKNSSHHEAFDGTGIDSKRQLDSAIFLKVAILCSIAGKIQFFDAPIFVKQRANDSPLSAECKSHSRTSPEM